MTELSALENILSLLQMGRVWEEEEELTEAENKSWRVQEARGSARPMEGKTVSSDSMEDIEFSHSVVSDSLQPHGLQHFLGGF